METCCVSRNNDIDYMELRLWIGIHSCLQCLLLVITDASYIIKYMTRFTEEGFSSLISFIFISDALKKMTSTFNYYPMDRDFKPDYITTYRCDCLSPDQGESHALGQSEWCSNRLFHFLKHVLDLINCVGFHVIVCFYCSHLILLPRDGVSISDHLFIVLFS